eukprot:SAG31_NODE_2116_length_6414_cov_2.444181_2_plen_209_part_00
MRRIRRPKNAHLHPGCDHAAAIEIRRDCTICARISASTTAHPVFAAALALAVIVGQPWIRVGTDSVSRVRRSTARERPHCGRAFESTVQWIHLSHTPPAPQRKPHRALSSRQKCKKRSSSWWRRTSADCSSRCRCRSPQRCNCCSLGTGHISSNCVHEPRGAIVSNIRRKPPRGQQDVAPLLWPTGGGIRTSRRSCSQAWNRTRYSLP